MSTLACPFCGFAAPITLFGGEHVGYYAHCPNCEASGPVHLVAKSAEAAWNTRVFHVAESCQATYKNKSEPPTP